MHERRIEQEEVSQLVTFLASLDLFKNVESDALKDLIASMEFLFLGGGDTLIRQGEIDSTLYILWHGRMRVFVGEATVAEITVGQVVGEIALLTGQPRTATVKATRDSTLLKLTAATFKKFEKIHPEGVLEMAKMAIKRLIGHPRQIMPGENVSTIAIAPAGSSNPHPFLIRLVQELEKTKSTLLVNKERVNKHFGKEIAEVGLHDPDNVKINNWLNQLESEWGFLIYETDAEMSPWTERCLRQADLLILVAEETASKELNSIEQKVLTENNQVATPCIDIVFLHPEKKAEGTSLWLEKRPLDNYHHLRLHSEEDFARLIRFFTGKAFGVVLNGGGVRGFAHSGVLKALDELQVPIDFIGGSSAGALVAAMYARYDAKTAVEICKYKDLGRASSDYTLPLISLLRGKNLSDIYHRIAGELMIEDCWTRFFCVSTNVTEGKLEVHEKGLIWVALRASTSLPGIYPPVFDEKGDMLVDGGILDNMPVSVMRRLLGGGKILGVNCHMTMEPLAKMRFKERWISGWRLFFQKFSPFRKKRLRTPPSIFDILRTSLMIAAEEQQKKMEADADYLLKLDTSKFALLNFENREQIIEIGYKVALEQLPKLLNL